MAVLGGGSVETERNYSRRPLRAITVDATGLARGTAGRLGAAFGAVGGDSGVVALASFVDCYFLVNGVSVLVDGYLVIIARDSQVVDRPQATDELCLVESRLPVDWLLRGRGPLLT